MSEPFLAEIRIFAGNFAPHGWALCDGQIMPISQNTSLFSLIGVIYGGDGRVTMQLPDLQGRAPMHPGQGPGLSLHDLGESAGTPSVTLTTSQIPMHTHAVTAQPQGRTTIAADAAPAGNIPAAPSQQAYGTVVNTSFDPRVVQPAGGNMAHNNMQPYLTLAFIIALQGMYPSRG
ncbi:hypothetical protein LL06_23290 [Hoeflea sp. BAL378]|uniref:phage tail protein n=1 Tax=Hoeflea sp. BAL378 TaxID=1547437 RepID=UPI000513E805|nr:tail fiber protein [Hoeflea sp. BAL378]KGF67333.1 hypothetical protein LL06_23290 [Hoeflea sp. BAL378]